MSQRVVDKDARALFRTSDATLTLTTCWPIRYLGSAPSRLIVTAKPVKRGEARVASANRVGESGGSEERTLTAV